MPALGAGGRGFESRLPDNVDSSAGLSEGAKLDAYNDVLEMYRVFYIRIRYKN